MGFGLKIISGKGAGRIFRFTQDAVRIGRLPDNDLVLYDMGVSRYHCEILRDGPTCSLRDTSSANGTLLNDIITTEAQLRPGDRIGIGPLVFEFQSDAQGGGSAGRQEAFPQDADFERLAREDGATSAFRPTFLPPLVSRQTRAVRPPDPILVNDTPVSAPRLPDPQRTATGSFVAASRSHWRWFWALPRSTKVAAAVGIAFVVLGFAGSIYIMTHRPRVDRSAEIFAADKINAGLSFGAGKVDVFTPDRVNFQFDFKGGRVTLYYAAGGVESPTEVELLVNGNNVGYVDTTPGRWSTGLRIALPRRLLKRGMNIVTFDNTQTPQNDERWGIAQVRIEEEPLPPPDVAKAKELFDLGKSAYEARGVSPPNLARAIDYYQQARAYLEASEPVPPLYATIQAAEENARQELQNLFDSYIFTVEKALRFNDTSGAADTLRELLRYFPDVEDPRYIRAKNRLNEILGTSKH